ncbi:MAG: response regulator [bacterium]|nr:response regulator [bacterium]
MSAMLSIIVDDDRISLRVLKGMASNAGLKVKTFSNPIEASQYVVKNNIDIALVDYRMKEMNGIEFIRHVRSYHPEIPIIMITGVTCDNELKFKALEAGATEFLTKPINAPDFIARVSNLVKLRKAQLLLNNNARLLAEEVKKATDEIAEKGPNTLWLLGKAAELKNPETTNHIARVAHYSKILAHSYNQDPEFEDMVFHSAPLHDVGNLGISEKILLKPGKLSTDESRIMQQHPQLGHRILVESNNSSKYIEAGAAIALTHHERYDGKGYPNSLEGEGIDILGRIVAISDVFDVLTTRRPYKEAWPFDEGVHYMIRNKSTQFDPKLVNAFTSNIGEVKKVYRKYMDG